MFNAACSAPRRIPLPLRLLRLLRRRCQAQRDRRNVISPQARSLSGVVVMRPDRGSRSRTERDDLADRTGLFYSAAPNTHEDGPYAANDE
jgi:hypothetical protein